MGEVYTAHMSEKITEDTPGTPRFRRAFSRIFTYATAADTEPERVDLANSVYVPSNSPRIDLSNVLDETYWSDFEATSDELDSSGQ